MNKKLMGLNTYIKEFKTNEEKEIFKEKNKYKYEIKEIFINNGYCLEFKKLKGVY